MIKTIYKVTDHYREEEFMVMGHMIYRIRYILKWS